MVGGGGLISEIVENVGFDHLISSYSWDCDLFYYFISKASDSKFYFESILTSIWGYYCLTLNFL